MRNFLSRTRSALKARALRTRLQSYGFVAYCDVSDGTITAWGLHHADTDVSVLVSMPERTPLAEGHRVIDREMLRLAVAITSWSSDECDCDECAEDE